MRKRRGREFKTKNRLEKKNKVGGGKAGKGEEKDEETLLKRHKTEVLH